MSNDFQTWLKNQGYYRKEGSFLWWKDEKHVSGEEFSKKLHEWKEESVCDCKIPYLPSGNIKFCSKCQKPTVY